MSTNTPPADDERDTARDTRLYLQLMFIVVFLLIVGATVYLSYEHPRLTGPLGTGATVATGLLAGVALVYRRR